MENGIEHLFIRLLHVTSLQWKQFFDHLELRSGNFHPIRAVAFGAPPGGTGVFTAASGSLVYTGAANADRIKSKRRAHWS